MKNENTPQINNYTKIFEKYIKTELKPDKKYSMLHTTISYLNLNNSDTVLDI
ncbi:MAG: hypothetical protein WCG25_00130 [bacterium]